MVWGGDRVATTSLRTWRGAGREGGVVGEGVGGYGDPVPNHGRGCPLRLVSTMREGGLGQELHHMRSYSI